MSVTWERAAWLPLSLTGSINDACRVSFSAARHCRGSPLISACHLSQQLAVIESLYLTQFWIAVKSLKMGIKRE